MQQWDDWYKRQRRRCCWCCSYRYRRCSASSIRRPNEAFSFSMTSPWIFYIRFVENSRTGLKNFMANVGSWAPLSFVTTTVVAIETEVPCWQKRRATKIVIWILAAKHLLQKSIQNAPATDWHHENDNKRRKISWREYLFVCVSHRRFIRSSIFPIWENRRPDESSVWDTNKPINRIFEK